MSDVKGPNEPQRQGDSQAEPPAPIAPAQAPAQPAAQASVPYQAQTAASPVAHLFFVGLLVLLAGFLWYKIEEEWTTVLKVWIGAGGLMVGGVLAWSAVDLFAGIANRRGAAFGFVALTVLLGTGVLGFVTWATHQKRAELPSLDLTSTGEFSLGDASRKLLDEVPGTLYAGYFMHGAGHPGFREKAIDQLRNYERGSRRVQVKVFDAFLEFEDVKRWKNQHGVSGLSEGEDKDVIILAYAEPGREVEPGNYREIPVDPLRWQTTNALREPRWAGERYISDAIQALVFEEHKAYVTGGHGEEQLGIGFRRLRDTIRGLNIQLEETPLQLATSPRVPEDCDVLVVLDPKTTFSETEAEAISRWLTKGGTLLLTLNPRLARTPTGLERVLAEHGVQARPNYLLMVPEWVPSAGGRSVGIQSQFRVTREDYTDHPAVKALKAGTGLTTLFVESCLIEIDEEPPEGVDPSVVVYAHYDPSLGENPRALLATEGRSFDTFLPETDIAEARLPALVAASRDNMGSTDARTSRVIVSGDTDMWKDEVVSQIAPNLDLAAGLFQWGLGREKLVAVSERTLEEVTVALTAPMFRLAFWLPLGVVFLPLIVGTWVWWTRRR